MPHARPRLVTFGISHFCEKARWALDWHGIAYDEVSWPSLYRLNLRMLRWLASTKIEESGPPLKPC